MQFLWNAPPVANTVYYFEIPANSGEYAIGAVSSSSTKGAYLMYLDISANANIEADSKLLETGADATAETPDGGTLTYQVDKTEPVTTYPTFFPLAWGNAAHTTVAGSNTGYLVSGANYSSNTWPGDIRVSRYQKNANGDSVSIRNSLTGAGILNNARVYTIINGTQTNVAAYGIGNQYTMQYARVSDVMNGLLRGNNYAYGLHFMPADISTDRTVTIPKATINGVTYTDYEMPEDCFDFNVAARGRITFLAATMFSGSEVNSFFSLHRIFRDENHAITEIREITGIYGDGSVAGDYLYKYAGDSKYYKADGTEYASLPGGYQLVFDVTVLSASRNNLTSDSVYYFEVPADPGEYALGSAEGNGAYLLYLDIAANADFNVETLTTEVTETTNLALNYPKGVAFVDAVGSTVYDTNSVADPSKSVFLALPAATSSGSTAFTIDGEQAMTVTNASLTGAVAQCVPHGASLTVNGEAPITATGVVLLREKVTEVEIDSSGTKTTTVTVTEQTRSNGAATATTITQMVTTEFGSSSTTTTTNPAPSYDGHSLVPLDYTGATPVTARTILEYTYRVTNGSLSNSAERSGELNIVETGQTAVGYNVFDVVAQDDDKAGTYAVTISGTAGTYTVNVLTVDSDFGFTINGNAVSATGERSVTVS